MRRIAVLTLALTTLFSAAAVAEHKPPEGIGSRAASDPVAGRTLAEGCAGCHGVDGIGLAPEFPNIAGQNAGYLIKQLTEMRFAARLRAGRADRAHAAEAERFRSLSKLNQRANEMMDPFVVDLTDQNIRDIATYYAARPCHLPTDAAARPAAPAKIVRCRVCHGDAGMTTNPTFPHLAGQKVEYLARALFLMRQAGKADRLNGQRGRTSGIMGPQAENLSDDEIVALAGWYATAACR